MLNRKMFIKNWKLVSISNVIDNEIADDESILIYLIEITQNELKKPIRMDYERNILTCSWQTLKIFHISLMKKNRQQKRIQFL